MNIKHIRNVCTCVCSKWGKKRRRRAVLPMESFLMEKTMSKVNAVPDKKKEQKDLTSYI